jgi:DNA-directed RNA polymerase specialized sigma24 family protein
MVDLMEAYSRRPDLLFALFSAVEQLRATPSLEPTTGHSVSSDQTPRIWRLSDRLRETDINNLVSSYLNGTTAQELAQQFRISKTSVKRLLRERGARRNSPCP